MNLLALLLVVALATVVIFLVPGWRRRRTLAVPFPRAWDDLLAHRLEPYAGLAQAEREQLQDLVRLFLASKRFFGCDGLTVTDEMRVCIAAQACLLLLNRTTRVFPGLHYILIYPGAFLREGEEWHEDGTVSEVSSELLGESWDAGKVILSWEDVDRDLDHFGDGFNVVLHEFAHQLDSETGSENGTPLLAAVEPEAWQRVMTEAYEALAAAAERGDETLLDPYGASCPAEFFAVLTETFFELPDQLREQHPDLFELLSRHYKVDPAQWYRVAAGVTY